MHHCFSHRVRLDFQLPVGEGVGSRQLRSEPAAIVIVIIEPR